MHFGDVSEGRPFGSCALPVVSGIAADGNENINNN